MNTSELRISFLFAALLLVRFVAMAQDTLMLQEAVALALEKNQGIRVSYNDLEMAENSATLGNADLLPRLDGQLGGDRSVNDVRQEFAGDDLPDVDKTDAGTTSWNAKVGLTYTIFSGMGNINRYKWLKEVAELADLQTRNQVELTILNVVTNYYATAGLAVNVDITKENLAISHDRYDRAKSRYEFSADSKLSMLNARVDLNSDSVNYIRALQQLQNSERDLNVLLGRDPSVPFEISRNVDVNGDLELEPLLSNALNKNAELLTFKQSVEVAERDLAVAKSFHYPRLDLSANYGTNQTQSDAGFLLEQGTTGYSAGLVLSVPIFNGNQRTIQVKNARLNAESNMELYQEALLRIERDLRNAYLTYQSNNYIYRMEKQNLETAQLNFERSREQFELGQITTTQFREAQLNLIDARRSLVVAAFNTKVSETDLIRASGDLLN